MLPKITSKTRELRRANAYRALLRQEAKMGGQLFGAVPANHRREFFCLDEHTWVWHEEWKDVEGVTQALTTRYDIRPNGIVKSQGSNAYQMVEGDELRNFYLATLLYRDNLYAQAATA